MSGPSGRNQPVFWVGLAVGWAVVGVGVVGMVRESADTNPRGLLTWLVGAALVHDGVWAVGVAAVAWLVHRGTPAPLRIPVQVGLASSALVLLVAWPLLRRYGERPATPSALPLDYGPSVAWALVTIWILVALWMLHITRAARRAMRTSGAPRERAR